MLHDFRVCDVMCQFTGENKVIKSFALRNG